VKDASEGINDASEGINDASEAVNDTSEGINDASEGINDASEGENYLSKELDYTLEELRYVSEGLHTSQPILHLSQPILARLRYGLDRHEIRRTFREILADMELNTSLPHEEWSLMFEIVLREEDEILYDIIKEAEYSTTSGHNFDPTRFVSIQWKYFGGQNRLIHRFCRDYVEEIDWIRVLMNSKIIENEIQELERLGHDH
jgi:hypothetical protein